MRAMSGFFVFGTKPMAAYVQVPIVVDAVQFLRDDQPWPEEVRPWSESAQPLSGCDAWIRTAMGALCINSTDWVLRWPDGAATVCKHDVFSRLYRPHTERR